MVACQWVRHLSGDVVGKLGSLDLGVPSYVDYLLFLVLPLVVPSGDGLQVHLRCPASSQTLWSLQSGVPELTVELGSYPWLPK